MTTEVLLAILALVGGFFGGLYKLIDSGFARWEKSNEAMRAAMVENTASNTALIGTVGNLVEKIGVVDKYVRRATPPAGIPQRAASAADFTAAHAAPDADDAP